MCKGSEGFIDEENRVQMLAELKRIRERCQRMAQKGDKMEKNILGAKLLEGETKLGKEKDGGLSKSPSRTPLNTNFGGQDSTKDLITKHFDYWNIHVRYSRSVFQSCGMDNNFLGLLKELCKVMILPFRYDIGKGGDGFRSSVIIGEGLHVLYDATFNTNESIDIVRVNIKGAEYSRFLQRGGKPRMLNDFKKKWEGFTKRIDLTINLFYPLITLGEIKEKLNRMEIDTKARVWYPYPVKNISTGEVVGESIYVGKGAGTSKRYLNIYDKLLEQISKKKKVEKEYWLRFELRLSDEWAENFTEAYFACKTDEEMERVFCETINDYFRPLAYYDESKAKMGHKNRIETWDKWVYLMKYQEKRNVNALKDGQSYVNESSMSTKIDWLERSCSKTLAMAFILEKAVNDGVASFYRLLKKWVDHGLDSVNNCDLEVLNNEIERMGGKRLETEDIEGIHQKLSDEFGRLVCSDRKQWLDDVFGENIKIV